MSASRQKRTLELRCVWPIEDCRQMGFGHGHRMVIVFMVESADDFDRQVLANGLALRLVRSGAESFVLVGRESEQAHDALDWVLEEEGAEEVTTSWHDGDDPEDIASFVVMSARANGYSEVVVLADCSKEIGKRLRETLEEAIRISSVE